MKNSTIFILLALSIGINAQKYVPFPTQNAQWKVRYITIWNTPPIDTTLLKYSLQGDTIINSTNYKRVCLNNGTDSSPIYIGVGGLREYNKRIYYVGETYNKFNNGNNEQLLYDFSKQIGDTVWVNQNNYYKINTIDSLKIGNEYRKRYNKCIIEGIGDVVVGLFGMITPIPTCSECYQEWEFVSFSQNGDCVYKNPAFVDCNSTQKWSDKKYIANDARWTYQVSDLNYQTFLNGDTIISGKTYKKAYHRLPNNTANSGSCPYVQSGFYGAIREESGKIYAIKSNEIEEYLLYDFTVNVGDTVSCKYAYPKNYLIVDSIDTITLATGEKRKVFNFPFTRWIEGIGSTYMLFRPGGDATTCAETSSLVCFKQNNVQLYSTQCYSGNCCDVTDGVDQIKQDIIPIKLTPNPVTGNSILEWKSNGTFLILTVSDLLGRTIKEVDVSGLTQIGINRSDFCKGIYIGKLKANSGSDATVKIVVQ